MKSKFHIPLTIKLKFEYLQSASCGCEDKYVKHYNTSKGSRTVRVAKEKCQSGQRAFRCDTLIEVFEKGKQLGKKKEKLLEKDDDLFEYLRTFNINV